MTVWRGWLIAGLLCVWGAAPLAAQNAPALTGDPQALAEIRAELEVLAAEMQGLRRELVVGDPALTGVANPEPVLSRVDLLEEELRRITGQVEALQFRIERIVADGTNRIGDLEFRLLELEGGDFATLAPPVPLGEGNTGAGNTGAGNLGAGAVTGAAPGTAGDGTGVPLSTRPKPRDGSGINSGAVAGTAPEGTGTGADPAGQITTELPQSTGLAAVDPGGVAPEAAVPVPQPETPPTEVLGEQEAFDAALTLYREDQARPAADAFEDFLSDYPGGPLAADAAFWRGESLSVLGDWNTAARAFLDSFSGDPSGPRAPEALLRLGESLGQLGQLEEACLTLAEVARRYPDADAEIARRTIRAQQTLACF